MKTLKKFYNWVMYDGVNEKFEDLTEDIILLDNRVEDLEDTVEALLDKLNVYKHYTLSKDFCGEDLFEVKIANNETSTKTKTKKPQTRGKK